MGALSVWDGTAWQIVSQQGPSGGNAMWVGPSAPPGTPATGDEWFDTDEVSSLVLPLSVANGGTGAANAAAARTNLAMPGEEFTYNEITSSKTVTSAASASPDLVIEGTSRSYDGGPVTVEFYAAGASCPAVSSGTIAIALRDGSTDLGIVATIAGSAGGPYVHAPVAVRRRITPTVGAHNYRIVAWIVPSGGSGVVFAGNGGPGTNMPAYVRVTRA